jgi:hypothetical protein
MFELTEGDSSDNHFELTDYQNNAEYDRLKKVFFDAIRAAFGSDINENYGGDKFGRDEIGKVKQYGAYLIQKRDGELRDGDGIVERYIKEATSCIEKVGGKVLFAKLIAKEGTSLIPLDENGEVCEEEDAKDWLVMPIYTVGWKIDIKH